MVLRETRLAPVPLVPSIRLRTLTGPLEHHWERLGSLPYWGHPWPGGQALARYLLDHPGTVAGRRVLDLASGSGLVAVAAARAGAASVTASDIDPLARAAVVLNARANDVLVDVAADDLLAPADGAPPGRWDPGPQDTGTGRQDAGTGPQDAAVPPWDVVLAGDACYEAALARRITAFLRDAARRGATALLGDPGRAHHDPGGSRRLAEYDVPTPEGAEGSPVTRTAVWQVLPPGPAGT